MSTRIPHVSAMLVGCWLAVTATHGQMAIAQTPIPIATSTRTDAVSFDRDILPIFRKKCLACHSSSEAYGDLVLESPAAMLKGGDAGPAIVAKQGAASLLLKLASHQAEPFMPPPGNDVAAPPMTSAELGLLKLWIDQGATSDSGSAAISPRDWRPLPPGINPIYAVAISPDGQYAACGRANQIFIYHVPTGQLITRLNDPAVQLRGDDPRPGVAHLDIVQSLAFNPDGDMLASGGFRTVKLWRRPRDVRTLNLAAAQSVTAVATSPNGEMIATALSDNSIKLWNAADGQPLATLVGHEGPIHEVRFSHDGQRLYSASEDRSVRVWQTMDGQLVGRIDTPAAIQALTVVAEAVPVEPQAGEPTQQVTAAEVSAAQTPAQAVPAQAVPAQAVPAQAVPAQPAAESASPSDQSAKDAGKAEMPVVVTERLLTGGTDNLIRLWQTPRSLPIALKDIPEKVAAIVVSLDHRYVAIGSASGEVVVQSLPDERVIQRWAAHGTAIVDLAFRAIPEPAADAESITTEAKAAKETTAVAAESSETAEPTNVPWQLATLGEDRVVKLWDIATGEAIAKLHGSIVSVRTIAVRPDGLQLAMGMEDGRASLWSLAAAPPTALRTVEATDPKTTDVAAAPAGKTPATAMEVSSDRKQLAIVESVGERSVIVIRDVESGQVTHRLLGHSGRIHQLSFSSDGKRLISAGEDATARIWDLSDAKFPEVARLSGHAGAVNSSAFSADATQAVTGGADNSVRLWNVADGSEIMSMAGHAAPVVAVAMTSANQPISASADKTLRVWNPADGKPLRATNLADAATALAMTADRARLAVATANGQVQLFDTNSGAAQQTLAGHTGPILSLAFSGDAARLVSVGADQVAMIWNAADGGLLELMPSDSPLAGADFGPTGEAVWTTTASGSIQLRPLRFAFSLPGMTQAVTKIAYRPDGQMVLTGSLDGSVRGFSAANGQQAFAANHGSPVQALAVSADGQRLASGGDDKLVKFWNAANGGQLAPTALPTAATAIRSLAFSADSVHLFVATADSPEVTMYDAASGAVEQRFAGREAAVAQVSAIGGDRQQMLTWSLDNRVLRDELLAERQFAGHSQPVTSLATVPRPTDQPTAARRVLSGSSDGTLREWDLNTGQATRQLNHGAPITDVAISGDGQRFASTSANNTAKLWNATNNQQVAELRGDLRALAEVARITRDKTAATAKQQATSTALAEAEKNLPVRTDAAKKAADALAAANSEVTAKQAALKTVVDAKAAAEKLAIEAAAVAQKAALAKAGADEQVAQAMLAKNTATESLSKAQSAVQADPNNAGLAQAVTRAQAAVTAADEKLKSMTADQAAKMKVATDASAAAADAATKAVAMNKPFLDANTALQTAETAQNVAAQAAAIADRELAEAAALVPSLKADVAALDQRLAKLETDLTAAQQAAQAAEQPLRTVSFSPDSRQLATGGDMGVVHTWDAETGKAVASCVGHGGPIMSLAFRDSDTILTGSSDKSAGVWNLNPGWMLERTIGSIDDPATLINRVPALAFSPDGKLLATGGGEPSRTGELKVWNVADGKPVMSAPEAHTDAIFGVCFSPDSTRVASGGADKYVRMFDIATGEPLRTFEGHTNHVLGVNWRADGLRLASCGADNSLRIWNAENGDRVHIIENFGKQVSSVRFIGQSVNTISCSADKTTRMHNSDNAQNFRNFAGATDFLYSADASPDGQFVIAGGFDSVLRVWNGTNSQVIHELAPPSESMPSDETVATQ